MGFSDKPTQVGLEPLARERFIRPAPEYPALAAEIESE